MALLQIAEPGKSPAPHQRKRVVGIDLGTTNSLVATVRSGRSEVISDQNNVAIVPSVVRYLDNKQIVVGVDAASAAEDDPENTLVSVKRLLAKSIEDVAGFNLPYQFVADTPTSALWIRTRCGKKSPVEVSAEILKVLYQRSVLALEGDIEGAVITVPAYFDDNQRQATKDAAHLAGINVLRLLNEPTAAAIAYGLDKKTEGIHLIYDLGGGTFDVSVLNFNKGVFEVLASGGDSALGGDDFDRLIAKWISQQMGDPLFSKTQWRSLLDLSKASKEQLSVLDSVPLSFSFEGREWQGTLTQAIFKELVQPLLDKTLRLCKKALLDAKVTIDEIKDVVLVGGSTRSPLVRNAVAQLFGREPLCSIDPEHVVALGAAIQADLLIGNQPEGEVLLLDVTPLSLGLEVMGGLVEKIIHRNTTIPATRAQEFTTYKDGQTALVIHVVQGERELVDDCRSLARFVLRGIPPMVAGAAKVRVVFQVDADGLLSVSAKEINSGLESRIEVKPSYGLDESQITRMLQDSFVHAREDNDLRQLRSQQVEAGRLLEAVKNALAIDGERLLCSQDLAAINRKIIELEQAMQQGDAMVIKRACDALNKASENFAAKRMDASIHSALVGHSVDRV
ncbi:MAG TPA: Fe-S protein assembly chaperone HscA [Pseudomonadales bacterium]|nr:Fe-S protein assembly chaperone HscA [Pseudomonadales bacterium]